MSYTFDELPQAVSKLHEKLDKIERLLLESYDATKEQTELLNIQQASKLINLSKATIYSKVSKHEIPFCKKGKRLYFSKPELTDWIKSGNNCFVKSNKTNYFNDYRRGAKNRGLTTIFQLLK